MVFMPVQAPPPLVMERSGPAAEASREPFNLKNPVEAQLADLASREDWPALCDQFDKTPMEVCFRFRGTWVEALGKAKRWESLYQLCDNLTKNPHLTKDPRHPRFLQQRARALSQLQRHGEAMGAWEIFGRAGGPRASETPAPKPGPLRTGTPCCGTPRRSSPSAPRMPRPWAGRAKPWRG
jgi:hypothetical protein